MLDHRIFDERPESQERLINQLKKMGFEYVSRSDAEKKRGGLSKVIFEDELARFLQNQTYTFNGREYLFTADAVTKAIGEIDIPLLQGLAFTSKEIYNLLIYGISLEQSIPVDGGSPFKQSFDLHYIDFDTPSNNIWQVTEEFSVERQSGEYARPDIVIMVNGLPLVVIECKKSSIDAMEGVKQNCRNMRPDYIPQLFKFAQIVMAVAPNKVMYGTAGTTPEYFVEWKEDDSALAWHKEECEKYGAGKAITEQDRIAVSLLTRKRFLDIVRYFVFYDGLIKKICRHQQYFAVNMTIDRINGNDKSDSKGGVIWHTQGSGKSLTMVMLVKKLQALKNLESPRFLLVTDRVNLDKQIRDNFVHTHMSPYRASTSNHLKAALRDKSKAVITAIVNKFSTIARDGYICEDSENFYILIDEAHRSQYSALYNYMLEVLPHATLIAFTGTPLIAKKERNTYQKFGAPIHNYTMKRAIEDKVTVPLVYEGRKVNTNAPADTINNYFDMLTADLDDDRKKILKEKFSKYKKLAETNSRLNILAYDIHDHFINYCRPQGLKAMIVCATRAAAVDMYRILKSIGGTHPAVVITFGDKAEGDGDDMLPESIRKINNYHKQVVEPLFGCNDTAYDDAMCSQFKNPDGDIDILIVKDKLLTGFDAPVAGVLYVDKSLKEHSLLQAIARVNRVYPGKEFGLIVDYRGIFSKLSEAIEMYDDAESGFSGFSRGDLDDAIFGPIDEKNQLKNTYADLLAIFADLKQRNTSEDWQSYLKDDEHGEDQRRKSFYAALKLFAIKLNLALTNRAIFTEVGLTQIEHYRKEYLFFRKLKDAVMLRFDDNSEDLSKYEIGIKNLLDTFVSSDGIRSIVKPVSIGDEADMRRILDAMESSEARADAIRTRIESSLKQVRYQDPLLFETFSTKIKKTLADYDMQRDADKYLSEMEQMKDDFRQGLSSSEYPASIGKDSDTKAMYGAVYTNLKKKGIPINLAAEEEIGQAAVKIKAILLTLTKRDWKHNQPVHKQIRGKLDDCLFDLFDALKLDTNDSDIISIIDLIIDEVMKVAVVRF